MYYGRLLQSAQACFIWILKNELKVARSVVNQPRFGSRHFFTLNTYVKIATVVVVSCNRMQNKGSGFQLKHFLQQIMPELTCNTTFRR